MKTKNLLIIFICLVVVLSIYFYYNKTKGQKELINNNASWTLGTISVDPVVNKEENYLWPKSKYYDSIISSRGDMTEPDTYYEKETIGNKNYETLTGWVRTDSLKIVNNNLYFNLYQEIGDDIKFDGDNLQPIPINLVKSWNEGKEVKLKDLSPFKQQEMVNIKIYYEQDKNVGVISKFLYGQEALAKVGASDLDGLNDNSDFVIERNGNESEYINSNSPIFRQKIYKVVLRKPYFEERVITYGDGSTFNEIMYYYLLEWSSNYNSSVKFNNSEWIKLEKNTETEHENEYDRLANSFFDHSKNLYHLDFYCSEFNNSCMAIIKAHTIEFDFNIPQGDKNILFYTKYQDKDLEDYLWESDTTIIVYDSNFNEFPVDVSDFRSDNPKLKRQNKEEYTAQGILSFEGEINCGQLQNFESVDQCTLKVVSLSFK